MADRIVLVEDDRDMRAFLEELFTGEGYEPVLFPTADLALSALRNGESADVVVTDLILPGMRGHELLAGLRTERPELNVIVVTAFGSIESAIEMVKAGAYDYLPKPFTAPQLLLAVRRALGDSHLRREIARLRRSASRTLPAGFTAVSRPMQELLDLLENAAAADYPVLITGETGAGKEMIARTLHAMSGARGAFVALNCAAMPDTLLESELFGHEKGAFTGASREHGGLFEAAQGGSILLDEIGEMPLALQPKLLRVIETGEVRRVGATRARKVDARVIAATNRVLEREVEAGRFREDLFWRLNVLNIHVPPLRERVADIPVLAETFLEAARGRNVARRVERFARETLALLASYDWPGNVRELRNVVERAASLCAGAELLPEHLPDRVQRAARASRLTTEAWKDRLSLADVERAYILEVLRRTGGNKSKTAEIVGLDRKTLYRRLDEYERAGTNPDGETAAT